MNDTLIDGSMQYRRTIERTKGQLRRGEGLYIYIYIHIYIERDIVYSSCIVFMCVYIYVCILHNYIIYIYIYIYILQLRLAARLLDNTCKLLSGEGGKAGEGSTLWLPCGKRWDNTFSLRQAVRKGLARQQTLPPARSHSLFQESSSVLDRTPARENNYHVVVHGS